MTSLTSSFLTVMFLILAANVNGDCSQNGGRQNGAAAKPRRQHSKRSTAALPVVEIAIFMDSFMWQHGVAKFGGDAEAKLKQYVQAIVSQAQELYHHPSMKPRVDLKVVHYEIWKNRPSEMCDSCIAYEGNSKASAFKMLDAFKPLQENGNWDAAFLMTGIEDLDGVAGVAIAGGICDSSNRASVISISASPADMPHELAHMLDMHHDEDQEMSNPSDDRKSRGFVWSANRIKHFQDLLASGRAECLSSTTTTAPIFGLVSNPASVYSADMQCQWRLRTDIAFMDKQSEFCNGIVCTNGRGAYAKKQVPIYRTPCGSGKYCAMSMDWSEGENRCVDSQGEFSSLAKYNFAFGNCRGNNLQKSVRVSLEICADRCDRQQRCKAFVYRNGLCQLKTSHCDLSLTNSKDKSYQFFVKF